MLLSGLLACACAALCGPARGADPTVDAARSVITAFTEDAGPRPEQGGKLNQALVSLTGEAINPLFGVAALGVYNYIRTDAALRPLLPAHDRPIVWVPLLAIIFLMLFNSTIAEALPLLKVPLNALGDLVNKAGAVVVLPLVVTVFADALAPAASHLFADAARLIAPAAYAGESAAAAAPGAALHALGWIAGAIAGTLVYAAVWLSFNVVDVLVLICPFPGIDALLKGARLAVLGILTAAHHLFPPAGLVLAMAIIAVSFYMAGWSFRLSVFGWTFSTDILLFRRARTLNPAPAFSGPALALAHRIPLRTRGRLERHPDANDGALIFSYRPWLLFFRRAVPLGDPSSFACGKAFFAPCLTRHNGREIWLRLPPRYRDDVERLTMEFDLAPSVHCGMVNSFGKWLASQFSSQPEPEDPSRPT